MSSQDIENLISLVEPVAFFWLFIYLLLQLLVGLLWRMFGLRKEPKGNEQKKKPTKTLRTTFLVGLASYYFGPLYSNQGLFDLIKGTDPKLDNILSSSPTMLRGPSPPWFLQNRHMQFAPWMLQNEFHRGSIPFERHELNVSGCIDKGIEGCQYDESMIDTISLDVFPPFDPTSEFSADFNSSSPILLIAPGLRCHSQDMPGSMLIRLLWSQGFRTIAVNRRAHTPGRPLKAPRWNVFGDVDDLEQIYWHVKNSLAGPNTPLFLHGISSGCAVVVRALSLWDKRKETHPELPSPSFVGSSVLTPGYDTSKVLTLERFKFPYNGLMTLMVKNHFVLQHEELLRSMDSKAVDDSLKAATLQDFLDAAAPFAGYKNATAYYEGENPVNDMHRITTPIFVINSVDDPCCAISNLYEKSPYPQHDGKTFAEIVKTAKRGIIAVTKTGSHCPFLDGTFLPITKDPLFQGYMINSWADSATVEYYQNVLSVYGEERVGL